MSSLAIVASAQTSAKELPGQTKGGQDPDADLELQAIIKSNAEKVAERVIKPGIRITIPSAVQNSRSDNPTPLLTDEARRPVVNKVIDDSDAGWLTFETRVTILLVANIIFVAAVAVLVHRQLTKIYRKIVDDYNSSAGFMDASRNSTRIFVRDLRQFEMSLNTTIGTLNELKERITKPPNE